VPLVFVFHPCIAYATTVVGRGGYSRVTFDDNVTNRDFFKLCASGWAVSPSHVMLLHGASFGGAPPCPSMPAIPTSLRHPS
jgi:hypothetical protein